MSTTRTATLAGLALVTAIGSIDAARDAQWDLFGVLVLIGLLTLTLVPGLPRGRHGTSLRADLARWVQQRGDTTGEPTRAIVDRAVADLRDRVEDGDDGAA